MEIVHDLDNKELYLLVFPVLMHISLSILYLILSQTTFLFLGEGPHKVISKDDEPLLKGECSTEAISQPWPEHEQDVLTLLAG